MMSTSLNGIAVLSINSANFGALLTELAKILL